MSISLINIFIERRRDYTRNSGIKRFVYTLSIVYMSQTANSYPNVFFLINPPLNPNIEGEGWIILLQYLLLSWLLWESTTAALALLRQENWLLKKNPSSCKM